jgi:transcriptional regulator with XRE-family HTH domain
MRDVGEYIREQRRAAQVSLRQLARLAGVSNPYLSQIERGLRKPSAEILQQIAKGLRISAEQLYIQAGILDERLSDTEVVAAILADAALTERQKQVLLEIYESFRTENASRAAAADGVGNPRPATDDRAAAQPEAPPVDLADSVDLAEPIDLVQPAPPVDGTSTRSA